MQDGNFDYLCKLDLMNITLRSKQRQFVTEVFTFLDGQFPIESVTHSLHKK